MLGAICERLKRLGSVEVFDLMMPKIGGIHCNTWWDEFTIPLYHLPCFVYSAMQEAKLLLLLLPLLLPLLLLLLQTTTTAARTPIILSRRVLQLLVLLLRRVLPDTAAAAAAVAVAVAAMRYRRYRHCLFYYCFDDGDDDCHSYKTSATFATTPAATTAFIYNYDQHKPAS